MAWSHFPHKGRSSISNHVVRAVGHQSSYTGQGLETSRDPKTWWNKQQQIWTQANDSCSPVNPGQRPSCSRCRSLVIFVAVAIPINCDDLHTIIASLQKGLLSPPHPVQFSGGSPGMSSKQINHGKVIVHKDLKHGQDYEVVMVGVPRTPTEFLEAARLVGHP